MKSINKNIVRQIVLIGMALLSSDAYAAGLGFKLQGHQDLRKNMLKKPVALTPAQQRAIEKRNAEQKELMRLQKEVGMETPTSSRALAEQLDTPPVSPRRAPLQAQEQIMSSAGSFRAPRGAVEGEHKRTSEVQAQPVAAGQSTYPAPRAAAPTGGSCSTR